MIKEIELAGVRVRMKLHFPETARYFSSYDTGRNCAGWDICVQEGDTEVFAYLCPDGTLNPAAEAYILMARVSSVLLPRGIVMFHGVSFVWRGKAWLITAPSGTGKTTQLRHWQSLWPDQIALINGDKSLLVMKEDGSFWVYPSPWTGKEGDIGTAYAPLAGIVVLRQSGQNEIRRLSPHESVLRVFEQFLIMDEEASEARAAAAMEDKLLRTIPIWLLDNLGDEESARLTHDTLKRYEESSHESV